MTAKPVVPRGVAQQDIEAAIDDDAAEGGEALALRFADAVEAAFSRNAQTPGIGSPKLAYELGLDGLRACASG